MACQYQVQVGIITGNDLSIKFHLMTPVSPNDCSVCGPHFTDNFSLIDRAHDASWGTGGLSEGEWRLRMEVSKGEVRE